jgi:hypothetical protein
MSWEAQIDTCYISRYMLGEQLVLKLCCFFSSLHIPALILLCHELFLPLGVKRKNSKDLNEDRLLENCYHDSTASRLLFVGPVQNSSFCFFGLDEGNPM